MDFEIIRSLKNKNASKIVYLVLDGLGGLPQSAGGLTALETAKTPELDTLAAEGICGLHVPIASGITPGSGPAHQTLFGYDAIEYQVGRGVLAALGINFDLKSSDVAARGNFCTVDENGVVVDRRAGRISTEKNQEICALLQEIKLPGVELSINPVKEHRFLFVLRGEGLSGDIEDTDPQVTGEKPLKANPLSADAESTALCVDEFVSQAQNILKEHYPANMVLLRGFAMKPDWPTMEDVYGIRTAAIAAYPMYRGIAKLLGMQVLETGTTIGDEIATLEKQWKDFDFFFLHVKPTDSAGEDGDYDRRVEVIEQVDALIPRIRALQPDVVIVTGDHSTPAVLKSHSWHPVPIIIWGAYCRPDEVRRFGERACITGGLGPRLPATEIMPLALANALRLDKYGA